MENNPILLKQLSVKYAGSMQKYEAFKKMMGASPLLYKHDFHFYNDDITTRHNRNIGEIKQLKQLLKEDRIQSSMLSFNIYNSYYPSYILHHHYEIFVPVLQQFKQNETVKKILLCSQKHVHTGAFFTDKLRFDLKQPSKETPSLNNNGQIVMDSETYFYSGATSPYITHCAFVAHHQSGIKLLLMEIRNREGGFSEGVKVKDFGATTSNDYISVGYNFSGVKPIVALQLSANIGKKIFSLGLRYRFYQFSYSLKDLQKSLWITINYTKMRRQFKTNQDNKEQRRIITYQAVATRIINGFSQFIALSDLYSRVVEESRSHVVLADILESSHHVILQHLIHLRQCCGGYGYMQISGHPGCIQRTCYRAGLQKNKDIKLSPEYLLATQYFAASQESQKHYCQPITVQKPSYMNYFGIFISIVMNMRKNKGNLTFIQFRRQFLKQSSLMAMHGRQEFSRGQANNLHCQILQYSIANYILKNSVFINWDLIKIQRRLFFERLQEFKNQFLQNISKNLQILGETLELTYLRNTVVGRSDAENFYDEVLKTSKDNKRNHKQYQDYVQAPIIQMIVNNRGKL